MAQVDALSFGLLLVLAGLVIWLALRVFALEKSPQRAKPAVESAAADTAPDSGDAVLVIESGGRPVFANARARALFHL